MEETTVVESSVSATIQAPIEAIDIPSWCFALPEAEYQACSPAHCATGATTAVHSSATPELLDFLGKQGIPLDAFRNARRPMAEAHNRQETPLFAKSIERHALARNAEAVAS